MIAKTLRHLRSNAIAYAALFVALSGTAYAATQLPKNSVGAKQLKKQSVNAAKVKKNSLTGNQINENKLGQVPQAANAANAAKLEGKVPADFLPASGTAVNADKLDGVDSAVFGNKQIVAGVNFAARDSSTGKVYVSTGAIRCTGGSNDFQYRVQLPQGARVTTVDYRFVDDEGGTNSSLSLVAFDSMGLGGLATETVATAASSGSDTDRRTSSGSASGSAATIDNGHYSYQLVWSPFVCGPGMQLVGAAVNYTLPTG